MRRCAHFLTSRLIAGVSVLTSRVGCGGDAVAAPKGVATTAMGRGALRVAWRCASTSGNSSSGISSSGGGGIRGSGEKSAQLWTMQSSVRDVLLCKADATGDEELWKFVEDKCKLSLTKVEKEEFIEHPEHYINDKELCNRIVSLPSYKLLKAKFKKAVEVAMHLEETAQHLESLGIIYLQQWKEYAQKDTLLISDHAKGLLDGALVQTTEIPQEGQVLTGVYESIYDASWSYVVKNPNGDPARFWLEVKDGSFPPQEWTDEEVDYLTHNVDTETANRIRNAREKELKEDEDNVQPTQERVVMKVLTSPKGRPYGLQKTDPLRDFFLTKEVERAWRVVRDDLRDWFEADPRVIKKPRQRVLIGTPGIGKSMAVGSYLLHQLLQYDANILPVVAYFIDTEAYIFDKATKQVTVYNKVMGVAMVKRLAQANYNGYTIYDCSKEAGVPPVGVPELWGTVVISSPNENNFKEWAKQKIARSFIINCPEVSDIKAMCAWKVRAQLDGLKDYWTDVSKRISNVGPILRYIFDDECYNERFKAFDRALGEIDSKTVVQYYRMGGEGLWQSNKVSHKIVKITRVVDENRVETFVNKPICPQAREKIEKAVSEAINTDAALMAVLLPLHELIPRVLETLGVKAFMVKNFVERILPKLTEFLPEESKRSAKPCVLCESIAACPDDWIPVPLKSAVTKTILQYRRLYIPSSKAFPVLDGFFFVSGQPNTIVGIQVTTRVKHDTTTSRVKALREYLAALFVDWDNISKNLSWEIIYVQHTDNKTMTGWQNCTNAFEKDQNYERKMYTELKKALKKKQEELEDMEEMGEEELEDIKKKMSEQELEDMKKKIIDAHTDIADHWNKTVRQYHLKISSEDIRGNRW